MEQDKKPPLGEVSINADITLTLQQLQAVVWFFGSNKPLSEVLQTFQGMTAEARTVFMDQLVQRFQNPGTPDNQIPPQE